MRRIAFVSLLFGSFLLLSSCAELALLGTGVIVGGAAGYYVGKEGYKVSIERERE